ncbi:MAG TPA: phytanoyl-CoA dioxygenase family protein [Blastocatellia bacterium]|nr:phytanoyl-CoA dioxygenase family protein [Blastocatellia bacterium]
MTVLDKLATALNRRDEAPNQELAQRIVEAGATSERASRRPNHAIEAHDTGFGPGFRIEEGVLSNRECDDLIEAVSQSPQGRSRAGARHLMSIPAVEALAKDERLLRIASRALGDGAVPFRATLFDKSGRANWLVVWHQDTALPLAARNDSKEWGPWSLKAGVLYAHAPAWALTRVLALRIHLDDSTGENGPLRVIPGSHLGGVLSDDEILDLARAQKNVEAHVPRGGVLAMRPLLVHSSSKARADEPRRVLHLEYAERLELAPGLRLAVA